MNIDIVEPVKRYNLTVGSKITAIYHFEGKLYIGFNNGDLGIYTTYAEENESTGPSREQSSLRSMKSFVGFEGIFQDELAQKISLDNIFKNTTKIGTPITKIQSIPIQNDQNKTYLAISDKDFIRIYEKVGTHLHLVHELGELFDYSDFQFVNLQEKRLLIVGVKKKVLVYQFVNKTRNLFTLSKIKEILLKERVRTISYTETNGEYLLLGLVSDFLYINMHNDFEVEPLLVDDLSLSTLRNNTSFSYFGLSANPTIWIISLENGKFLLVRDTQIVELDTSSASSIKQSPIKLHSAPFFVAFIKPSYLFILYNKKLEIVEIDTGDVLQKFYHHINSNSISACQNEESIFVSSSSYVLVLGIIEIQKQVNQFLSISKKAKNSRNNKDPNLDNKLIGLNKSIALISKLDENDEFFENEIESRKKRKYSSLRYFYKLRAIILFENYSKYNESLIEIGSEWLIPYNEILAMFPDFLNAELILEQQSTDDLESVKSASSVRSYTPNMIKKISAAEIQGTNLSLYATGGESGTENETDVKGRRDVHSNPMKSQKLRRFIKAVNNLIIYLTDQRRILSKFLADATDSLLWKGVELYPYDIYPITKTSNIEEQLHRVATIIDTTLFLCYFYTKPMLLGPLLRLPNNMCDAKIINEYLLAKPFKVQYIQELLDFYYGRNLHENALSVLYNLSHDEKNDMSDDISLLRSPQLTIRYLQRMNNSQLDLIFQYAKWILLGNDDKILQYGEAIFMNETYECESYDKSKVLDYFLSTIDSKILAIRYLEWILYENEDTDTSDPKMNQKFGTKLGMLYLGELKNTDMDDDGFFRLLYYQKLSKLLSSEDLYEPWTILRAIPVTEDKFLRLVVLIYHRLGEHSKSIDILYNQLNDLDSAMEYCAKVYHAPNNAETGRKLLHKLLDDLLIQYEVNIDDIVKLLSTHGTKMSILSVLAALPNSFPLSKLSKFMSETIRDSSERLHKSRINSRLHKLSMIKLQDTLLTEKNIAYYIESGKQLCSICNKKLGYSIYSVDNNNQVVHYGCYQRQFQN